MPVIFLEQTCPRVPSLQRPQRNMLDRDDFESMKDEFYALCGWDVTTGLQTKAKLQELGLQEITADLEARGLVV